MYVGFATGLALLIIEYIINYLKLFCKMCLVKIYVILYIKFICCRSYKDIYTLGIWLASVHVVAVNRFKTFEKIEEVRE
jgi:hypothetical protein